MEIQEALAVIRKLADGTHPETGALLSADSHNSARHFSCNHQRDYAGRPGKNQPLSLVVTTSPDYSLSIANPSLTAPVNSAAQFNGVLTSINGYASSVALSCGTGAPPTCTVNPASATPTTAGTHFAVTVSSNVAQSYNFNIIGVGNDAATISHSAAVAFTALSSQTFDFTMGISPATASVPAGQPAIFSLDVSPTSGSFPNNVSFSCSKLPALTTCGFNPPQVGSGSENSAVTFTLTTTATIPASRTSIVAITFSLMPLAGLFLLQRRTLRDEIRRGFAIPTLILTFTLVSCGGGLQGNGGGGSGSPGTPAGTYIISVTATCGSVTHSA